MRTQIRTIALGALLLPVLLIPGCKECPECPPEQAEGSMKAFRGMRSLERRRVCKTELGCGLREWPRHFRTKAFRGVPTGTVWPLKLSALDTIIDGMDLRYYGVKFHYGAVKELHGVELRYAMQLVRLTPRRDALHFLEVAPVDTVVYPIKDGGHLDQPISLTQWDNGQRTTYYDELEIGRMSKDQDTNGMAWDALVRDHDHGAYIFHLAHIDSLLRANRGVNGLDMVAVAAPAVRVDGVLADDWSHDLVLVATIDSVQAIDDTTSGTTYKNRGLDLGSPCPPSCVLASFRRYGTPPTKGCGCP